MVVVMEWMQDTVGCTLESAAERVVITVVVVVAHLALGFDVYFDVFSLNPVVARWSTTFVFDVDEIGVGAAAIVSLGDVYLGLSVLLITGLTAVVLDVNGISGFAAVDIDIDICLSWTAVATVMLALGYCNVRWLILTFLCGDLSQEICHVLRRLLRLSDRGVDVLTQ